MKRPIDWEYELNQEPPKPGSDLYKELKSAAGDWGTCAIGESRFDRGQRKLTGYPRLHFTAAKYGWKFLSAIESLNWKLAKEMREQIRALPGKL